MKPEDKYKYHTRIYIKQLLQAGTVDGVQSRHPSIKSTWQWQPGQPSHYGDILSRPQAQPPRDGLGQACEQATTRHNRDPASIQRPQQQSDKPVDFRCAKTRLTTVGTPGAI